MVKAIKKQIEYIEYREKQIFWTVFSMFIILLVIYGFLVNKTFMNASSKDYLSKQITLLNTEVNKLEFEYLNTKNNVNMALAVSKGFVLINNEHFAELSGSKSLSLTVNKH